MNERDEAPQLQGETTVERTLAAIGLMEERVRANAHGFDRVIVNQALPLIRPRLEQRIRAVPETELIAELRHVQALLHEILGDPRRQSRSAVQNGYRVGQGDKLYHAAEGPNTQRTSQLTTHNESTRPHDPSSYPQPACTSR
ncbi:hypothetical protein GCM10025858_28810 [Alicyclobacillus sacchari]|nr:hypothetical protein GCM10025858_28810 [Alicyclobacillus sacchari]